MSRVNVRYIVSDVDAAIPFYTDMLDFKVVMHPAPGFASLSRGDLQLLLNRPGAGGAGQAMSAGQFPSPGGWNRIQIEVDDIEATVEKLKTAGARFRNEIVTGNGGKQILIEDPSGNPIELFQPFWAMLGEAKAQSGAMAEAKSSLRSATENAKLIRMRLWMCSVSAAERPNHIQQHNGWRRNHAANGDA